MIFFCSICFWSRVIVWSFIGFIMFVVFYGVMVKIDSLIFVFGIVCLFVGDIKILLIFNIFVEEVFVK